MKLKNDVFKLCKKLATRGWGHLLKQHGLQIAQPTATALEKALLARLPRIDRTSPGFADFSPQGTRGIEPGSPARSLLFHALASPDVVASCDGHRPRYFATPAELELIENYIYGIRSPSLRQLQRLAGRGGLAIVVFSQEYRPGRQTCHRLHADMAYARCGVARVGTSAAVYHGELRGFVPEVDDDPYAIAVLPAQYAAYLAVQKRGSAKEFRPLRYRGHAAAEKPTVRKADNQRRFWVPIHKLFSGDECIAGMKLTVNLTCHHANEKLRRVDLQLTHVDRREPPYVFTEGIAEFSDTPAHGQGLLLPIVHRRLVEPAETTDAAGIRSWVTYQVPLSRVSKGYDSVALFEKILPDGVLLRNAPQYVNAKTLVRKNGDVVDLNEDSQHATLRDRIKTAGSYRALHYVDYTGDGWVQAHCPELEALPVFSRGAHAAYSLVTAPDFFPRCDQVTLTDWTEVLQKDEQGVGTIWKETPPDALSDQRYPANLQLPVPEEEIPFRLDDDSITALVSHLRSPTFIGGKPCTGPDLWRHNHLPDDAAGIFDPGWDVSLDHLPHDESARHLAAYGLGSPFPEDAKLCAALSAFWPSVSPDTTRLMQPMAQSDVHTTCPLTDEEIGQLGHLPWDGVIGPRIVHVDGVAHAEFANFFKVDYVRSALAGKFSMRLIGGIESRQYEARVLAMAAVHGAISQNPDRWNDWIVLSFRIVRPVVGQTPRPRIELSDLQEFDAMLRSLDPAHQTGWSVPIYRFEMISRRQGRKRHFVAPIAPYDFRKRLLPVHDRRVFFVDPNGKRVSQLHASNIWHLSPFRPLP